MPSGLLADLVARQVAEIMDVEFTLSPTYGCRYHSRTIDCVHLHTYLKDMTAVLGYDRCHCLAIRRGSRHVTRLYDAILAPTSLSASQFAVLSVIDQSQPLKAAELGRILVMERTTLLRSLKPLQSQGLIETRRPKGERAHFFNLTPVGKARLQDAIPFWEKAQVAFESEFGSERAVRLRDDNLAINSITDV